MAKLSLPPRPWAGTVGIPTASRSTKISSKQNAEVMASLEEYGWKYVGRSTKAGIWPIPLGKTPEQRQYLWSANGLLIPVPDRFPPRGNGAGFRPLADWVHAQGLKFGIHIVRGIPRAGGGRESPHCRTSFHAADAADLTSPCPWDEDNWGVKDNAAGQAYYDSRLQLYASGAWTFSRLTALPPTLIAPQKFVKSLQPFAKPAVQWSSAFHPAPPLSSAAEVANMPKCGVSPTTTGMAGPSTNGPMASFRSGSPGIRSARAVVLHNRPGQLARRRHASRGLAWSESRLGSAAPIAPHSRRTANRVHPLVRRPLAAHLWRQSHSARCAVALTAHEPDIDLHRPERQLQPAG